MKPSAIPTAIVIKNSAEKPTTIADNINIMLASISGIRPLSQTLEISNSRNAAKIISGNLFIILFIV
jgi:hypothetical protein